MGFNLGRFVGDVLTGGSTYFKRQKKAKKQERAANEQIARNTAMAEDLFNRDYGQSQWADVPRNERTREMQWGNLFDLQDVGRRYNDLSQTGFTDLDRQALDQAFMRSRREEQGQRQAALNAAARRGDARGGNALLGSLMAQQGGSNRAAQHATDVGLAGRDRALQALEAYGTNLRQQQAMASGMQGQDFAEDSARASGLDAFNQWATGQRTTDAQVLANARLGQASNLQAQAAANRATPVLDAGIQAGAAYLSGGATAAAGGLENSVGAAGGGSAKGASAGPSVANAPGSTQSAATGPQQKSMAMGGQPNAQNYAARRRRNRPGGGPMQIASYYGSGGG